MFVIQHNILYLRAGSGSWTSFMTFGSRQAFATALCLTGLRQGIVPTKGFSHEIPSLLIEDDGSVQLQSPTFPRKSCPYQRILRMLLARVQTEADTVGLANQYLIYEHLALAFNIEWARLIYPDLKTVGRRDCEFRRG